ncbi:MAG: histone-like nucleoid-structuring protein Lsr2, partial [Humibacillus sp.]
TDGLLHFIGSPPHGVFVQTGAGLTLARFATPLQPALADLVRRHGAITIPAPDVDRFLTFYFPTLRQLARVGSHDGSVELPEVRPPRLALRVAALGDHRLGLRWSFRYVVGDGAVDVSPGRRHAGAGATADPVPRDPVAEEALLAGIVALDAMDPVAALRVHKPGLTRLALVLEPELAAMDTVVFVRDVLPALEAHDDVDVTIVGELLAYVESTATPVVAVSASDPADPVDPSGRARDADASRTGRGDDHGDDHGPQLDWFDLGIDVSVEDRPVPLARLLQALAADETHLILDDGTWFSLDVPTLHTLRRIVDEARTLQDRLGDGLRINRFQAGLWAELVELGVVAHQAERWSRSVEPLLGLGAVPRPDPPAGLVASLRPYQLEGYQWLSLLWDHQLGGILADDMGLGKTLQALAMAERARAAGTLTPEAPLLVVAPTSVVSTWLREAARFTPELKVTTLTETQRRSGIQLAEAVDGVHVVVTSYAIFRIDEDAFRACPWGGLVLDEAQFVKNHQARTYAAARRLPAPFKLAITGTPLENSLMDLWALLSIVAPGLFPSPQAFGALYRRPIESGTSPEMLDTLRRRIRPLMLRRTKEAVAPDLPPKVEQVVQVELDPRHRRIYDRHLARERQRILGLLGDVDRNRFAILSALTKLRQLSLDVHLVEPDAPASVPSSKVDALIAQLTEVAAEGHRCLVFSQFTRFLAIVRRRLDEAGLDHVYLDGRTRDRPTRIASFVEGDAPVFVISLKAGGSGLTLTEADYVFVLDPWWNPAVEAQAIDRAHRIGQDKTVMVYRLVSEGTIEEKVLELQERKRELFTKVVDEGGLMGAPLTAEDIRGLLGVVSDAAGTPPVAGVAERSAAPAASRSGPARDRPGPSTAQESSAAEVRAWARSAGLTVGDRGRLSPEIWDAYRQRTTVSGPSSRSR